MKAIVFLFFVFSSLCLYAQTTVVPATEILAAGGLEITLRSAISLDEIAVEKDYLITGFTMSYKVGKRVVELTSTSEKLSIDMKKVFVDCQKGDVFKFEKITAKTKEGLPVKIQPFIIKIK